MCGLCGAYGWLGLKEKQVLAHLQLFSQLRGTDSTGVAVIPTSKNLEPAVFKAIGGVESLVLEYPKEFDIHDWELERFGTECVISHHRKATVGKVDIESAHPFDYDNIIGCHNGTILNYHLEKLDTHNKDKIDSQIVLEAIDKTGNIADVIKKVSTTGAWAFVWWDKAGRTLNFCRNEKRTVCIAYSEDEKTMFWASEAWMLHTALKRVGVKYNGKVGVLKEDKHIVFGLDKKLKVRIQEVIDAPGFTIPTGGKVTVGGGSYSYSGPKGNSNWPPRTEPKQLEHDKKVVPLVQKPDKTTKEQFEEEYAPGFCGRFIPKRRYLYLVKTGCSCCDTPLDWDKRKEIRWLDEQTPLCVKCQPEFEDELDQVEQKKVN